MTYRSENADSVIAAISEELSKEYDIYTDESKLEGSGSCTTIDASASVGGKVMPEHLQKVYVIPAGDGAVVGTAHYAIEASEGFGRRFAYMMNTLTVIDRS
ncbi:MAG: hypothetical protein K6E91_03805 [Butyrivibrio sp.]|nr:hypothetical protein [Butyrivibrio sp.]